MPQIVHPHAVDEFLSRTPVESVLAGSFHPHDPAFGDAIDQSQPRQPRHLAEGRHPQLGEHEVERPGPEVFGDRERVEPNDLEGFQTFG